ncbi:HMA2 domain-containing protein [Rhizobium sullae]|uniref:Uncharacterized protein n=1 Tax=Rhizobium sullae TaxID=50338 RepID=A0A4R3PSR9_RHISU|nr:hypothetical protein [Rhizobium sullae]TCU04848.1 hypothetical protein EV132_13830 [Rhizobium sullae]
MNVQIVHSIPGRLRLKIPAARDQIGFLTDLQQKFLGAEGVLSVRINPAAASVVILHDDSLDPQSLGLGLHGLIVTSSAVHAHREAIEPADNVGGRDMEVAFLLAKLLPLMFARHPVAQLAELLGEPILRAVVAAMTRPQSHRLPARAQQGEEPIAIAA